MPATRATLTSDDVRHIARLARLELTEDEIASFTKQLGDVLRHADALQAIDTSSVPPTSHALMPESAWRDDTPIPSLSNDALLANAPDAVDAPLLFRVPKVLG